MWPSILIISLYTSFVIDFLVIPIPSEASTASIVRSDASQGAGKKRLLIATFLISLTVYLTPLVLAVLELLLKIKFLEMDALFFFAFAIGLVGRVISIWGSNVLVNKKKEFVNYSIFSLSRNPIALGMYITLFGLLLCYLQLWWLWLGYTFYVINLHSKVMIEERHLISRFGQVYQEYMKKTPRYLWK